MNKEALAKKLHGTEYPLRISSEIREEAKKAGLVIVYGASDDLMEFDGAIYDEVGVYDGGEAYVTSEGLLDDPEQLDLYEDDPKYKDLLEKRNNSQVIQAIWGKNNMSFQYKTEIPHATFDVVEDDEIYCRGIVFELRVVDQVNVMKKVDKF